MIRFFFLRVLGPLLLFLLLRAILRSIFASGRSTVAPRTAARQQPPVPAGGELKKDPVCGTYVSPASSVTLAVQGQVVHFCSEKCRDQYRVV